MSLYPLFPVDMFLGNPEEGIQIAFPQGNDKKEFLINFLGVNKSPTQYWGKDRVSFVLEAKSSSLAIIAIQAVSLFEKYLGKVYGCDYLSSDSVRKINSVEIPIATRTINSALNPPATLFKTLDEKISYLNKLSVEIHQQYPFNFRYEEWEGFVKNFHPDSFFYKVRKPFSNFSKIAVCVDRNREECSIVIEENKIDLKSFILNMESKVLYVFKIPPSIFPSETVVRVEDLPEGLVMAFGSNIEIKNTRIEETSLLDSSFDSSLIRLADLTSVLSIKALVDKIAEAILAD